MFIVCRNYLESVLKNSVGITRILFKRGTNAGNREARIFSMPSRGRLEIWRGHSDRIIKNYYDLDDLDDRDQPRIKSRVEVAKQQITFVVELSHRTDSELDTDFHKFISSLTPFIYDGQTIANYKDDIDADTKHDTKGNRIEVSLGNYDFNDNKFYGDLTSKCYVEVSFDGAIYKNPDPEYGANLFTGEDVSIDASLDV